MYIVSTFEDAFSCNGSPLHCFPGDALASTWGGTYEEATPNSISSAIIILYNDVTHKSYQIRYTLGRRCVICSGYSSSTGCLQLQSIRLVDYA